MLGANAIGNPATKHGKRSLAGIRLGKVIHRKAIRRSFTKKISGIVSQLEIKREDA